MFSEVAGRIWASTRIGEEFHAICACGGRFSGTASETRAVALLERLLGEATGTGVVREPHAYRGWTRGPAAVTLGEQRFAAHALVRSPATTAGGLTRLILDLGRGTTEDFERAGAAVAGAIVLVRHEFMVGSSHFHRRRKYDIARVRGAAGFLVACNQPGGLLVTGSSGDGGPGHIPAAGVAFETAAALALANGAPVNLEVAGTFAERSADNLFAELPGESDEWVVLSAHIDGHDLASSAIDNASGLAAVLALARAVRHLAPRLRRGIRIALFNIEEWALLGSALHLAGLDAADRRRIAFNLNLDSVAGAPGLTALTSRIQGVEAFVRRTAAAHGLEIGIHSPFMGNSDHANFIRAGIPALRLCAGFGAASSNMRLLLTPGDTPDKVTAHQLKEAATVAAALLLAACTGEQPPAPPLDAAAVTRATAD